MSDELPTSSHPGTLSPRNIDTVHYRVIRDLPVPGFGPAGSIFSAWPQGETFACVSGIGLGPVKNSDIASWLEAGLIERTVPLTAAQERDRLRQERLAATPTPEIAPYAVESGGSRPWTLPSAVAAAEQG